MVSKACVVGAYQTKLEAIGKADGVELTVVVPPAWKEAGGNLNLERSFTNGYDLRVEPIALNGHCHQHFYPRLGRLIKSLKPDIVHMDEEPYSLVTWLGMRHARAVGARTMFFSWQNIFRHYPPPFSWMEKQVLGWSDFGQMGNAAAEDVWRRKGYRGDSEIFPQFGVSLDLFRPKSPTDQLSSQPFTICSASRRLPHSKGLDLLMQAATKLTGDWRIRIAGDGDERAELEALARDLGIAERVQFDGKIGSEEVPDYLKQMDVLVLPSRTTPTWKEQFGRVLVEAMATGVPVIGSDSGEIPHVIGDAGLVFAEGDVDQFAAHLQRVLNSAELQQTLAHKGRQRVENNYTQEQIARRTVKVYRSLLK